MLLLLSRFSCVQLLVTPWMAAYQAPPSMGFSRQEYWSGVPLPSQVGASSPGISVTDDGFTSVLYTSCNGREPVGVTSN